MGTGMRGFFCASGKVHFYGEESRNCPDIGKAADGRQCVRHGTTGEE